MSPLWLLLISIALVVIPVLAFVLSLVLSKILGCEVNEAGTSGCYILGIDIGDLLYALSMSGWLLMMTGPVAGLGIVLSFIWFIADLLFG